MNGFVFNTKAFLDRIYRIDWIFLLSLAVAGSNSQEPIACGEKREVADCDDSVPGSLSRPNGRWCFSCFFRKQEKNQIHPFDPVDPVQFFS
jgi:hypothetical protein